MEEIKAEGGEDESPVIVELKEELEGLMQGNGQLLHENQMSMGDNPVMIGFNQMKVQIEVLIGLLCEDDESRLMFEVECQKVVRRDIVRAVEEMAAAKAREALTGGIDLGGGLDLSALREKVGGAGGNRQQRRDLARTIAKDITRGPK